MSAWSRRSSKAEPEQSASSFLRSSSSSTGTGCSGTCGGVILAMGLASISPSSTRYLKNCCRARKRLEAVDGFKRASTSWM